MIARIRSALLSVNASYWFYPALFSTFAFFLSFFTIYLDRHGGSDWFSSYDWLHVSRPAGARTTLTVIAGSMIGVASTVFSITIAAVAYASGNYGPRLLTNFMEDKGNQLSLATFIATFVYALMVIRTVRDEDERAGSASDAMGDILPGFTPQISLMVAMIMAIFAVAVLVYFLHHIPASIRINTVLKGIGERLIRDIKRRYPSEIEEREPRQQTQGEPVIAKGRGYIDIIDFDTLDEVARKYEATIALKVRTGDFIHPDVVIAELSGAEADEEIANKIRNCFSTGGMRTATQDLEYLIDELVEIALRALSPGINDPFTAITSMHWMGAALAELGSSDLDRGPEQEDYDWDRVQPLSDDFRHYIERSFGAMRSGVATNRMAAINFINALFSAATSCESDRRLRLIGEEAETMVKQARHHLVGPSLEELEARLIEFNKMMESSSNALLARKI